MNLRPLLFRQWQYAGAVFCAMVLVSCTVGPDFVPPVDDLADNQMSPRTDNDYAWNTSTVPVSASWWTLFNDPILTDLQKRAQSSNLDLQIASERIEQSRAQLGIASSQLLPDISGVASYAREANSANGKFAALGAPTTPDNFWQLGFDASWEIDLWGHARRMRESADATLQATVYDREAVRVALSAEIARTYLQLRGTQTQLDITHQNLDIASRALSLTENRERNGVATRFETATARAQLATVKALVPELVQRRNVEMNALALLLGQAPRTLDAPLSKASPLPVLPDQVPIGLPSELAHRRPDIRRAEAKLHAATADIGVAKADFYPRIGLRGRAGMESFDFGDLNMWDSRAFSVGPTVYLPIFQGGRLTQKLALSESRQKNAALSYRQTVLHAWHEVDDALDALAAQQRQHSELQASYEQNQLALHAAVRGYEEGAADYLSVLTAQRNVLASQTSLNASAINSALSLVNLYKALGGGWDPESVTMTPANDGDTQ
jgi:NodT family efflux transporter outer membrane factor (OMF) lipoprotein